ncbi:Uncharacterised protein [Mycobacteroides abscessus subsp. abscessus]|nr:Uncharacterised protein [Mycobacteroides abscessus subsp. abscessus]
MSEANFSATTLRFTLSVGVISPVASVKSTGKIRNFLIASACETTWLAAFTAVPISASRSESSTRSATVASAGFPLRCFQPSMASGSMVIRAPMKGCLSPTAMAWLING